MSARTNTCIVGLTWGDEAKGKIVDLLSAEHDVVVRYNGGNNAGHTVAFGGETYKLHLVPSGMFHAGATCVIGGGLVVDPQVLPYAAQQKHCLEQFVIALQSWSITPST